MTEGEAEEITVLFSIHRHLRARERPDLISLQKFHTCDWRSLSLPQLKQLNAILTHRRAARQRAALAEKTQLKLSFR